MTKQLVARNVLRLLIGLTTVTIILLVALVYQVTRPPRLPRIIDEHGNNLVYTCPGDPRCTPVVR